MRGKLSLCNPSSLIRVAYAEFKDHTNIKVINSLITVRYGTVTRVWKMRNICKIFPLHIQHYYKRNMHILSFIGAKIFLI
jgi:hypothetical protein